MWTLIACVRDAHNPVLVCLSLAVCAAASTTALRFHRHARLTTPDLKTLWAALTGISAGAGVWATHFIAVLAYQPSLPVQYDVSDMIVAAAVAMVGMGTGFSLANRGRQLIWQMVGGAVSGLAVVAMHFIGVAAVRTALGVSWDFRLVAASIAVAMAGAMAALVLSARTKGVKAWILPPLALLLGFGGLHFTAMSAMIVPPDLTLPPVTELLSRAQLALITTGVASAIMTATVGMMLMEAHGRREGQKMLAAAFRSAPSGLALFDASGRLSLWNSHYAEMLGLVGVKPARHEFKSDLGPEVWDHANLSKIGAPQGREHSNVREVEAPDGRWFLYEDHPLDNGGALIVVTDISPMRKAAEALEDARAKAESANRAKSEFLANMSHEIRTPLNGVLGMAQVMEADDLKPAQRERVQVIRESGVSLLAILNDLLDLSKAQAGKLMLDPQPANLAEMARQAVQTFDGQAAAKGLDLTLDVDKSAEGFWLADELRVRQILTNLVGNAVKFTLKGRVDVTLGAEGRGLTLRVRDTGIGIPEGQLDTLFDKFAQGDASMTRRFGGTGLGLSICREMATLMGGAIAADSEPDVGSCFTVTLPLERTAAPERAAPAEPAGEPANRDEPLRILAAEDNPTNQLVLRSLLAPLGCELVVVDDGRKAVDAWEAGHFDVVLMDIQMPNMNGIDATRAIRAREVDAGRGHTPILALSANVMTYQILEYREAGMDGWIAKPIELDKLYAALDQALSGPADHAQAA